MAEPGKAKATGKPDPREMAIKIINNAKEVIFHVTGSGKKYVVEEIINHKGSYKSYPGSYINPKSSNLSWYLDFDAAEMLTK